MQPKNVLSANLVKGTISALGGEKQLTLDTIGNCQKTSLLSLCISTNAQNNEPVKI